VKKRDTDAHIAALCRIVKERPIDTEIDRKLGVLVDAYEQCCQDNRSFVEFYQDMWRELSKAEHKVASCAPPVWITTTDHDDFSRAMEIICAALDLGTQRRDVGWIRAMNGEGKEEREGGPGSWEYLERHGLLDKYYEDLERKIEENQKLAAEEAQQDALNNLLARAPRATPVND